MPPHTTYLRITPHSVIQVRTFTEHPLDAGRRWLIHPTDPALPKIITAIKHLILPKLREENFRKFGAKAGVGAVSGGTGRGVRGKKKVKDVVSTEEFEVALFLTELGTRHSLLVKQKHFREKGEGKLKGNSSKMTNANEVGNTAEEAVVIREESPEDDPLAISDVPEHRAQARERDGEQDDEAEVISSDDEHEHEHQDPDGDDKKKLGFKTSYEGFSIWGWTLVLLVKRKDDLSKRKGATASGASMLGLRDTTPSDKDKAPGLMEEWISTQAAADVNFDDEDAGD